ncbi:histone H1-like [Zingiber officinale]|nr:histone H1-like [Zingiber officinale]
MVVASATPPAATATASHSLQHPPYKGMIVAAVKALKDKQGSSAQAISKFMRSTYSDLPLKHGAILKRQLRRLKKRGVLLMVRHSYKLASAVDGGIPVKGEKRRPGRPRKVSPAAEGERRKPGRPRKSNAEDSKSDSGASVPKRKPGRPRKSADVANASDSLVSVPTPKRKPGRPRKGTIAAPVLLVKRKRGRPPKSSLAAANPDERNWSQPPAEAAQSGENQILGGPPLASAASASPKDKRKSGRPPKSSSDPSQSAAKLKLFPAPNEPVAGAESSGKRKRGRPRKFSYHAILSGESPAEPPKDAATSGGSPSAKRKPGRPPGSISKKPNETGSQKRGRPKKHDIPMPTVEGPDTAALSIKRRGRPPKKKDLEPTA